MLLSYFQIGRIIVEKIIPILPQNEPYNSILLSFCCVKNIAVAMAMPQFFALPKLNHSEII